MKWRQGAAILRMELKKNFITKRGFWIYLLALAPVFVVWLHSFVAMGRVRQTHDIVKDTQALTVLFQMFFLRPALFFGCVGIFTYLFRGEVVEKSLHYYFLSPVRREVQVIAKYLAGLVTATFFFGASIVLTFAGMYAHYSVDELREFGGSGGFEQLAWYLLITLLACAGWGAVCLWMGIRYRNPIVPSVILLLWESVNAFLPAWLRKLSVLHYLQALAPVQGAFQGAGVLLGFSADRVPALVAVSCVLAVAAAFLLFAARQLQRAEISYSSD